MKTKKTKFTELFIETEKAVKDNESINTSLEVISDYIYAEKCSNKSKELCMSIMLDGKEYFLYEIFDKIQDVITETNESDIRRKQRELLALTKKVS